MGLNKYYVYILIDPRNGKPFYVGKGSGRRMFDHVKDHLKGSASRNKLKDGILGKIFSLGLEPTYSLYKAGMSEGEAYDVEAQLIKHYGRRCNNTGCLTNLSENHRAMTGVKRKGRTPWNKGLRGIPLHSEEYKLRLRKEMSVPLAERVGTEKAATLTQAASHRLRGRKLNEILGEEKAAEQKRSIKEKLTGKSLEDIIGADAAFKGRKRRAETYQLQSFQFTKGQTAWNKGMRKHTPEEKREIINDRQRARRARLKAELTLSEFLTR